MEKRPGLFHAPYLASIVSEIRRRCVKTLIVLAAINVCLLWTPSIRAQNHTFKALGPVSVVRANGAPAPVTTTFNVLDPATAFTMQIDSSGVSSAIITLNGVEIFKTSDFNATIKLLTKSVKLLSTNKLSVEMRGSPGESLSLQI